MTSEVQIERIEHFIGSSDGTSQLRVLLWIPYLPENELKGIVQICLLYTSDAADD